MGEVYRAHDRRLGRDVAIKRVRADRANDAARQRLRREARVLAQLKHPVIVPIFDILEEDDGDWLVMELVTGVRLDHLLLDGPVTPAEAIHYGWQIAQGLVESHEKGILHRDLKTENAMVTNDEQIRLLDFGLARPAADLDYDAALTGPGQILGTVRAMSPEQARGLDLDERSDLFSLGVLLYELVTGESPFSAATANATLVRVCSHRQPPAAELADEVPEALSQLIDELLHKAPERRPGSAADVVARLAAMRSPLPRVERRRAATAAADNDAALLDTVGATPAPSTGDRSAPPRPRAWRGVLLAVLGVALLAGGLAATSALWPDDANDGSTATGPREPSPGPTAAPPQPSVAPSFQLLQKGRALLARYDRKNAIDQAIETFKELSAQDPESAAAYAGLAEAYWRKYRNAGRDKHWLQLARAAAQQSLGLDRHLARAHLAHARVQRMEGEAAKARESLARVLALEPGHAHAHLERGHLHAAAGDLDDAEAAFRTALERAPRDREILDELAAVLYRQGRFKEAEATCRKSIEVAPDGIYGYRNLASMLQAQGRYDAAAAALQQALAIRPSASLYTNLGTLLFFQGLHARAAEAFERALEQDGGAHNPFMWANLGDAYLQLPGRESDAQDTYKQAIRLLREQLETRPDDLVLRTRLALFLARSAQRSAALETLAALVDEDALGSLGYYRTAMAYELCGQRTQALAALERALMAGYSVEDVVREPDLTELRADPAYQRLLGRVSKRP